MGNLKSQRSRRTNRKKKRRRQKKLDERRNRLNAEFATQYLTSLLDDAKRRLPSYRSADWKKDIETLTKRISSEGLPFLTTVLPRLSQGLFDLLEGRTAIFDGFSCRSNRPLFLKGLFDMAMGDNEAVKVEAIRFIYLIAVSFKKLKGPYKKEVLQQQWLDFVKVDKSLPTLDSLNEDEMDILLLARSYMAGILDGLTLDDAKCVPRPGPGATNTPTEKHMRYRPHKLYPQIESVMSFHDGWYTIHPWDTVIQSDLYVRLLKEMEGNVPTSRFKFVPKVAEKPRGICIEENEVQYLQQAIRRLITAMILSDPYLRDRIALDRQIVNALLALESSITQERATIDESEASDRIARCIVSFMTRDNNEIHDALMALSTRIIIPPEEVKGEPLMTQKFAPMGSALCFPIMSLVHFCLIRAIIMKTADTNRFDYVDEVYVYGDDIVIPSAMYDAVTAWLPRFGMKINLTKSFVNSKFRESCGIHAYNGVNITPVYINYVPHHRSDSELQNHLSKERQLIDIECFSAADTYRRWIRRHWQVEPVPESSNLVGLLRPSDAVSLSTMVSEKKCRWCEETQQPEFKLAVFHTPKRTLSIASDSEAYVKYFTSGRAVANPSYDIVEKGTPWTMKMRPQCSEIEDALTQSCIRSKWVRASACGALAP